MRQNSKSSIKKYQGLILLCVLLMQCVSVTAEYSEITTLFAESKLIPLRLDSEEETDEDGSELNPPDVTPIDGQAPVPQCTKDSDCEIMQVCLPETSQCHRKKIFPMTLSELIGSILIMVVVGVGQSAGVGGGLIVVPLLMSFFNYEAKKSIALVFVTILSASFANLYTFMQQKFKDGGPLIDYRIVTLSLPTIMVGSIYGVAFNKFLPMIAISALLVFFILQSLLKTYKSYKSQKAKETKENEEKQKQQQQQQLQDMNQPLLSNSNSQPTSNNTNKARQYPSSLLQKIAIITASFVVFSLLRGGKRFDSLIDIPACGIIYHICNLCVLYLSFILVKAIIAGILIGEKIEEQLNPSISCEKKQTAEEMQVFAKSAFLAGLIGAIVGIGGGMILVPKWLEFGISAQKTSACSISLLFLTAFNSVIQFSLAGVFELEEFIYFSVLAFLSSILVSSSISAYVKRTNQSSLLIFIILCFMVAALIIFSTLTIEQALKDASGLFLFGEFC